MTFDIQVRLLICWHEYVQYGMPMLHNGLQVA